MGFVGGFDKIVVGHESAFITPLVICVNGAEFAAILSYERVMSPQEIKARLSAAFPGDPIEVTDLTGTEDHYEVFVQSKQFSGRSRIEQHQMVMAAFQAELKSGEVHALSIRTPNLTEDFYEPRFKSQN